MVALGKSGHKTSNRRVRPKKVRDWKKIRTRMLYSFAGLATLCGAVLFLACVSVASLYCYRYITTTDYFATDSIVINGIKNIPEQEIRAASGLHFGDNIFAVRIDAVQKNISTLAWVKSASIQRILPNTFQITIEEHTPSYWMQKKNRLYYADATGEIFAPVQADRFIPLPLLMVECGAEEMQSGLPQLVEKLATLHVPLPVADSAWIRLSPARGIEFFLEQRNLRIGLNAKNLDHSLQRFNIVLADMSRRAELDNVRDIRVANNHVWLKKDAPDTKSVKKRK